MAKPHIDDTLISLADTDRAAKKAFIRHYVETLCDEVQACRLSDTNPLDLDYWKTNDAAFVGTLKTLKAQINGSLGLATKQTKQLADAMRKTLSDSGLYSPLLEPQISNYSAIQYDLDQLAKRKANPFYDPLSGNSISPLEKLTKERRAELQVCLKALGLTLQPRKQTQVETQSVDPLDALR